MSSFEWIGNHYKLIGNAAGPRTKSSGPPLEGW